MKRLLAQPSSDFPAFVADVGQLFADARDRDQLVDDEPYLEYEQWEIFHELARYHKVLDNAAVRSSLDQVAAGRRHAVPARQLAIEWRTSVDLQRSAAREELRQSLIPPPASPAAVSSEPPQCPRCDRRMVPMLNSRDASSFWGCSAFPDCRGSRPK
jgi:hypothetical protein